MTVLAPRHVPSSQKSNSTSCYASIVQEIKNQVPPSPTSLINHQMTISPPVPKMQTLPLFQLQVPWLIQNFSDFIHFIKHSSSSSSSSNNNKNKPTARRRSK